jgi:hypothetical protein
LMLILKSAAARPSLNMLSVATNRPVSLVLIELLKKTIGRGLLAHDVGLIAENTKSESREDDAGDGETNPCYCRRSSPIKFFAFVILPFSVAGLIFGVKSLDKGADLAEKGFERRSNIFQLYGFAMCLATPLAFVLFEFWCLGFQGFFVS